MSKIPKGKQKAVAKPADAADRSEQEQEQGHALEVEVEDESEPKPEPEPEPESESEHEHGPGLEHEHEPENERQCRGRTYQLNNPPYGDSTHDRSETTSHDNGTHSGHRHENQPRRRTSDTDIYNGHHSRRCDASKKENSNLPNVFLQDHRSRGHHDVIGNVINRGRHLKANLKAMLDELEKLQPDPEEMEWERTVVTYYVSEVPPRATVVESVLPKVEGVGTAESELIREFISGMVLG